MGDAQYAAVRVLSQVSGVGASERNWKAHDWIHNKRRNRLLPERAEQLVKLHGNLLVIDRKLAPGVEGEFWPWVSEDGETDC